MMFFFSLLFLDVCAHGFVGHARACASPMSPHVFLEDVCTGRVEGRTILLTTYKSILNRAVS